MSKSFVSYISYLILNRDFRRALRSLTSSRFNVEIWSTKSTIFLGYAFSVAELSGTSTFSTSAAAVDILEETVIFLAKVEARADVARPLHRTRMIEYDIFTTNIYICVFVQFFCSFFALLFSPFPWTMNQDEDVNDNTLTSPKNNNIGSWFKCNLCMLWKTDTIFWCFWKRTITFVT